MCGCAVKDACCCAQAPCTPNANTQLLTEDKQDHLTWDFLLTFPSFFPSTLSHKNSSVSSVVFSSTSDPNKMLLTHKNNSPCHMSHFKMLYAALLFRTAHYLPLPFPAAPAALCPHHPARWESVSIAHTHTHELACTDSDSFTPKLSPKLGYTLGGWGWQTHVLCFHPLRPLFKIQYSKQQQQEDWS